MTNMTVDFLDIIIYTVTGTAAGALISLIPSLHIYNTAGIALILWSATENLIPYPAVAPFFISLVVAFAFVNTLPMTLIGAPDESATVTVLPGMKYLMSGKGYEAVVLTSIGALIGLGILVVSAPLWSRLLPFLHGILSPHMHWIIMAVIVYMLMSEWPKGEGLGVTLFQRLKHAWSNLAGGLLTFGLAGLLGLIVTSRSLVGPEAGFQNIMPVFVGLFAIPGAIQHLLSRESIPHQHIGTSVEVTRSDLAAGTLQGLIGGGIAAYLPG
ncbi:tripartite tricarboxylate transporter permease, partial [bacterium]|nr:tripartite tricarboxylate transporter permease [candidate division CSSED10-310 bacterium]